MNLMHLGEPDLHASSRACSSAQTSNTQALHQLLNILIPKPCLLDDEELNAGEAFERMQLGLDLKPQTLPTSLPKPCLQDDEELDAGEAFERMQLDPHFKPLDTAHISC